MKPEDSKTSWLWRNDTQVWKFTGNRPDKEITYEIEKEWIATVLTDSYSKRFAIIVDDVYVGNIQLTNLTAESAQYHIFIGNKEYWGKGIGQLATFQILNYAKEILNLKEVYLYVNCNNLSAIVVYEKNGFERQNHNDTEIKMICILEKRPNPTVSIFCMVYNHEKYIAECLEGFLFQKCNFNYTIILGEDCSKDNSRNIILDYAKRYPGKFKLLLHNDNIGAHKNQNELFKNCHGKYIAICEGDDYWIDPLKLQKQVDFLEANEEYVVCGTYCDVLKKEAIEIRDKFIFQSFNFYDAIFHNPVPTLTICFRNRLIDYETLIPYPIGDIPLILSLTKNGGKVAKLPFNSAVYRYHGNGANSGNSVEKNHYLQLQTKKMFLRNNDASCKANVYFKINVLNLIFIELKNVKRKTINLKLVKVYFSFLIK